MSKRSRCFVFTILGLTVVALAMCCPSAAQTATKAPANAQAPAEPGPAAQYVGSDVCKSCHEEIHNKLKFNPHEHLLAQGKTGETEWHGCESCHGPGSAHVEGGGDKTKIVRFPDLSPEKASAICQQCHQAGDRSNFHRSSHLENGIGCTSCHSIHGAEAKSALLKMESPKLCYGCHTEMKAEFSRPYRHRVNEGLIQCSDCHNEHGGMLPRQVRTSAAQDQVCYKCHTEKRGPFVYEHLPVKTEGCTSCHTPHGSTNPRLLKVAQVNQLCLQCHTLSMNNIPSQPPIGPAHNQAQKYQACTMCHAFIHGSNFSEVFFKP
ncbi:MAG: DmsE family decaheme c-type cytochrome [Terriglobales bacterium]